MESTLTVVKIGGGIIDQPQRLQQFLQDFARIEEPKILVHGGGKSATQWAHRLGIPQKMKDGRRITDAETLQVATMVYGGLLNKNVVAELVGLGVSALGLSGADGNLIRSVKRPVKPVDFGFVGDVKEVHAAALHQLLKAHFTPVFCALTHDGKGQLLNTNADTLATEIAIHLSSYYRVGLYYCFEKSGVLKDINDERSRLPVLSLGTYRELKENDQIFAGMIPKLENAFYAGRNGVKEVTILRAEDFYHHKAGNRNYGTIIKANESSKPI